MPDLSPAVPKNSKTPYFSSRLRAAAGVVGLSCTQLAFEIDSSTGTSHRYWRGKQFPEPKFLKRISKVLGVSVEWLTRNEPLILEDRKADIVRPARVASAEMNAVD